MNVEVQRGLKIALSVTLVTTALVLISEVQRCGKPPKSIVPNQDRIKALVLDSIKTRQRLAEYKYTLDSLRYAYAQKRKSDSLALDSLNTLTADQQAQLLASKHGLRYQVRNGVSTRQHSNSKNK